MSGPGALQPTRPVRVCLLIRQLNLGGAQRQLAALVRGLEPRQFQVSVVTFYPAGVFAETIENARIYCLDKRGRWDIFPFLWRAIRLLRNLRPEVIYSFMGGSNVLAMLCHPFLGRARILWGVRGSGLELRDYRWPERVTAWMESSLSSRPAAILCNSRAGLAAAAARGYPLKKLYCVPNGIDGDYFRPLPANSRMRRRWEVKEGEVVLGLVGRNDPMKGHDYCFEAIRHLRQKGYPVRLVLVGYGKGGEESLLRRKAEDLDVADCCSWEPFWQEMPDVYGALDLLVSSSVFGEGFPNVVAESMSCGIPCVATDVGDSALLVGTLGEVVPARDPVALADGIERMLVRLRSQPELRSEVRASILARYSLPVMVEQTAEFLRGDENITLPEKSTCESCT